MNSMKLISLGFNKISFNRIGGESQKLFKSKVSVDYYENEEKNNLFKMIVSLSGQKEDEYEISIELQGIFDVNYDSEEQKKIYLDNALNIMMPYIRSQVTLLTSQPNMKPVILPLFNFSEKNKDNKKTDND